MFKNPKWSGLSYGEHLQDDVLDTRSTVFHPVDRVALCCGRQAGVLASRRFKIQYFLNVLQAYPRNTQKSTWRSFHITSAFNETVDSQAAMCLQLGLRYSFCLYARLWLSPRYAVNVTGKWQYWLTEISLWTALSRRIVLSWGCGRINDLIIFDLYFLLTLFSD